MLGDDIFWLLINKFFIQSRLLHAEACTKHVLLLYQV